MRFCARRVFSGILALFLLCAGLFAQAEQAAAPQTLKVHFLPLGRVDGILLECGETRFFIDSGTNAGGKKSVRYLKALGIDALDGYIGTHAHRDHVGGAARIIAAFSPATVYVPYGDMKKAIVAYAETPKDKRAAKKADYTVLKAGDEIALGDARIDCLGPLNIEHEGFSSVAENNNSLILKVTLGNTSFLLTADTREQILDAIDRKNPGVLASDVLKNPHHNADISLASVARVAPKYVVFTTDESHVPLKTYTAALLENGVRLYSTANDDAGCVVFTSDGENIRVEAARKTTAIRFKKTDIAMTVGQKGRLTPLLTPKKRYGAVAWSSGDESIVKVDATGMVKAVGPGETVVRAASAENPDVYAQADIRVRGAEEPPDAAPEPPSEPEPQSVEIP